MRILIADDEAFARAELLELLDRMALPPDVRVSAASDGIEALEQALQDPPDLLITDVRMPRMDGIELARQVARSFPACRMIFLSNYSDKPYLRAAIQLHAVEYIDKPVDREKFQTAVSLALAQLQSARAAEESLTQTRAEARALLCQRWTQILCSRRADPDALRPQARQYGLDQWFTAAYRCVLYRVTGDAAIPAPKLPGVEMLPLQFQGDGIAVRFLYADRMEDLGDDAVRALWEQSRTPDVTGAAADNPAEDYRTAAQSYREAQRALDRLFFRQEPQLELASETPPGEALTLDDRTIAAIEAPLIELNASGVQAVLDQLFARLRRNPGTPVAHIRNYCCKIADHMLRISMANHLDFHERHTGAALYRSIWEAASLDQAEQTVNAWTRELLTCDYGDERLVRLTVAYIRRHYADRDLDLPAICAFVGYSPSSLCPLFKKTVGMTINAYITETRMEQARELLLNTDDSLEQIAAACGYASAKYFGRSFKLHAKMSPGEFRQQGRLFEAAGPMDSPDSELPNGPETR